MKIHLINKEIITTGDEYYNVVDTAITMYATKVDIVDAGKVISIITKNIAYYSK